MGIITIGVDEVGRGCIWGPLVVAAVASLPGQSRVNDNVRDSKLVKSQNVRHRLATKIKAHHLFVVAMASAASVDRFGIDEIQKACTVKAAEDLIKLLAAQNLFGPVEVILDGAEVSGEKEAISGAGNLCISTKHIPHADNTVYEVSAASLVAKDFRDSWCGKYVADHPELSHYGFASNFGYGSSPTHDLAIRSSGLTAEHRTTFCRKYLKKAPYVTPAAA